MKISLSLQQDYRSSALLLKRATLKKTLATALEHLAIHESCEIGVACVDVTYSQALNLQYRGKDKPTNVLSFPSDIPDVILPMLAARPLGDLIICIPVVLDEAQAQHKLASEHFEHLVVHGLLHLLGYDHELGEQQAEQMEALEIAILAKLGINNPYLER